MNEQADPGPDTVVGTAVDTDTDTDTDTDVVNVTDPVTHDMTDDVPALAVFPEPDLQGQRSMLVAAGAAAGILAITWALTALVPEHNTGPLSTGVGGFWNFGLSIITFLIWAAGIFGAGFSLLFGASAWGQSRVKNARAARGENDPQPQGTPPFSIVLLGGGLAYIGIVYTAGVLQGVLQLVGAVVILLGLVRLAVNLFAPNTQ